MKIKNKKRVHKAAGRNVSGEEIYTVCGLVLSLSDFMLTVPTKRCHKCFNTKKSLLGDSISEQRAAYTIHSLTS